MRAVRSSHAARGSVSLTGTPVFLNPVSQVDSSRSEPIGALCDVHEHWRSGSVVFSRATSGTSGALAPVGQITQPVRIGEIQLPAHNAFRISAIHSPTLPLYP